MTTRHDLVIIGMGSCGITAAEFAAELGLKVAVVERARIGGDCLWTGCVPSKALIAAARTAHTIRRSDRFGIRSSEPNIDLAQVWDRVRDVRASIADTDDDPARFAAKGIDLVHGMARLTGPTTVLVDEVRRFETRYVLVCTGSRPAEPPIPGLAQTGFLTSDDLFELRSPPRSAAIIGGGPVGVELGQAFTRLGIDTTLLQRGARLLPNDEPVLVDLLTAELRREGLEVALDADVAGVGRAGGSKRLACVVNHRERILDVEEIVVATGRESNAEYLGLEELGIEVTPKGIVTDGRGRTTVSTVYAAGDVTGRHLFTHSAAYEGVRAVRDMFFPGRAGTDELVPWCTFTDPELAHVGLTVAQAESRHGHGVDVFRKDLHSSDRARADRETGGSIVIVTAKGKIVGAHVLAPHAGEMIHELALAIRQGLSLADLAALIHVYPTYATSFAQMASEPAFERARRFKWLIR